MRFVLLDCALLPKLDWPESSCTRKAISAAAPTRASCSMLIDLYAQSFSQALTCATLMCLRGLPRLITPVHGHPAISGLYVLAQTARFGLGTQVTV